MTALAPSAGTSISEPGALSELTASAAEFVDLAYRLHLDTTYASAMRTTRDPDAAADVTQEAFIRLLTEARRGRRPDNPAAWLCRAATNVAISGIRRTTVARRLAPKLLDRSTPAQPEAIAIAHEREAELGGALATLRPAERRALILASEGSTGLEIARVLGRTHGATRALICRARATVRNSARGALLVG